MDNLRKVRIAFGDTPVDAANFLGISRAAYARYELGSREPGTDALKKLATRYGTTVDYLIGGDDDQAPKETPLDDQAVRMIMGVVRDFYPDAFNDKGIPDMARIEAIANLLRGAAHLTR